MAYLPHTLFAMGGHLSVSDFANPQDVWECTIRLRDAFNADPVPDPAAYMGEIAAGIATWFHGPTSGLASTASLEFIKVNSIGTDGRYSDAGTTNQHDYSPPILGAGGPSFPQIMSVCTSWTTARTRGIGAFGRIYLPNYTVGTPPGVIISSAGQDLVIASGKALLDVLANGAGTAFATPVIASKGAKTGGGFGAGICQPITGVRVGNRYDVQRRRDNSDAETYRAQAWTP